jgi:uncharacterized protein (UPF0335 family)
MKKNRGNRRVRVQSSVGQTARKIHKLEKKKEEIQREINRLMKEMEGMEE